MVRLSRRSFLTAGGALALAGFIGPVRAAATRELRLTPKAGTAALAGPGWPETEILGFDGRAPGPEIRVRQGDRLRITVHNELAEETTVHWHGIRLPIAMDGVPGLTQNPIPPGGSFLYDFEATDAGTYWYHPHVRGFEQIDRGLSGALIVEEPSPPAVDRDVVWVLDDWRLGRDAQITDDFAMLMDISHGGRIGNTVTINGAAPGTFSLRAGERIRLRLINVANARLFSLLFEGHAPQVIAWDGQPIAPHVPEGGRIVIGPAMRADVILDATGAPGGHYKVVDDFYRGRAYRLIDLAYADAPLRREKLPPVTALPRNTQPEPALADPIRHTITLTGGMMGRMSEATLGGERLDARSLMMRGKAWALNGVASEGTMERPLFILPRGRTCVLTMVNDTAWPHPMHLHGLPMKLLTRQGRPPPREEWRDTVLLMPGERVEMGIVADNPGDWLFHCHIAEHMEGGMMGVIRVD